jgi:hypothetical protein
VLPFPIGHEPFQVADTYRIMLFGQNADDFALFILRADAAAYGGQGIGFFDLTRRFGKFPFSHQENKSGNIDFDRTTIDTFRFGAGQTSFGFSHGQFRGQPKRHLIEILDPIFGFLGRHILPRYFHPFFVANFLFLFSHG